MIEFIALHLWQMWAILAVLCLILELTAGDFFIICFSIGAVFACITDALGGGIILQLVVFAVFTLASLFFVRPFAVRFLHTGESNRVSNADAHKSTVMYGRLLQTSRKTYPKAQTFVLSRAKAPSLRWKGLRIEN